MKKIPFKNYVLVSLFFLVTIFLGIYFVMGFNVYNDEVVNKSKIKELTVLEYSNYLYENSDFVMFFCMSSNECRNVSNMLYDVIVENDIEDKVMYFDIDNKDKIDISSDLYDVPVIAVYNDRRVIAYKKISTKTSSNDIVEFFKDYEVIESE